MRLFGTRARECRFRLEGVAACRSRLRRRRVTRRAVGIPDQRSSRQAIVRLTRTPPRACICKRPIGCPTPETDPAPAPSWLPLSGSSSAILVSPLRSLPLSARSGGEDGRIPAGRECPVCVHAALLFSNAGPARHRDILSVTLPIAGGAGRTWRRRPAPSQPLTRRSRSHRSAHVVTEPQGSRPKRGIRRQ